MCSADAKSLQARPGFDRFRSVEQSVPESIRGLQHSGDWRLAESVNEMEQQRFARRLDAMRIKAHLMKGGRAVLATLPLGPQPFEGVGGSQRIEGCVFATVGKDRIKCLRPRALFQLPILSVGTCGTAKDIERVIREAWRAHQTGLAAAQKWLRELGSDVEPCDGGSTLSVSISGEGHSARATWIARREIALPSRGPLEGRALRRPQDRIFMPELDISGSAELEIRIVNRMEELGQLSERIETDERTGLNRSGASDEPTPARRTHRVLLVGPQLAADQELRQKLELRSYDVQLAHGEREASKALLESSPEIVLADIQMGRSDGVSFVLVLRGLTGIEELPVVLVDDHRSAERRETAKRVGAAGYVVRPIEVAKIADKLRGLATAPPRRRYTRYRKQLSVRVEGLDQPCLASSLSRGGLFLAANQALPTRSLQRCAIALPETGKTIEVDAEVLYRKGHAEGNRSGFGLRFERFTDGHESALIHYLGTLAS